MAQLRKTCIAALALSALVASGVSVGAESYSTIALETKQSPDGGVFMRIVNGQTFSPPGCKKPEIVTRYFMKGETSERTGESVRIPAEAPLGFTAGYGDSKYGLNRVCAVSGAFVPQAGYAYTAQFSVASDLAACSISLTDQTGAPVGFQPQDVACGKGLPADQKSGVGSGEQIRVQVHVTPAGA